MGTREIYVALIITFVFIIFMDYLLNENSMFCCLPSNFTNYHIDLLENANVTEEEYLRATETVNKFKKQKNEKKDIIDDDENTEPKKPIQYQGYSFLSSIIS